MNTTPLSDLQRKLKEQSKKNTRSGHSGHMASLETLAKNHNFLNYNQLHQMALAERRALITSHAEVLACPAEQGSVYRIRVGPSLWSLRFSQYGPQLILEYRPHTLIQDRSNTSDIGLFQVLMRASEWAKAGRECPQFGWVVTRYGSYLAHTAEFLTDDEAHAISHHFGIPISGTFNRLKQGQVSEISFLSSPSFAALRRAIRHGEMPLPALGSWGYGLSPLWQHLVAISDKEFRHVKQICEWYFEKSSLMQQRNLQLELSKHWNNVPHQGSTGKGIDNEFIRLFKKSHSAERPPKNQVPSQA